MKSTTRVTCLDQTRALAIIAMIIAHFGPGIFDRITAFSPYSTPVLFMGRFATTAFLLVFGITLGFVHFDRFQNHHADSITIKLRSRALLLFFCSIAISAPKYLDLALDFNFQILTWAYRSYSILNYYTLALVTAPIWFRILGKHPFYRGLTASICLWSLACCLLAIWPHDPGKGVIEYIRMHLVSGPYAYLQMTAVAFIGIPIGNVMRLTVNQGQPIHRLLFRLSFPAVVVSLIGFGLGQYLGEFDMEKIAAGEFKAPPHAWYFLFFGGASLLMLIGLGTVRHHIKWYDSISYPITLFGQCSLSIYVSHKFVLPAINWSDRLKLPVSFLTSVSIVFAIFGLFCTVMLLRQHLRKRRAEFWRQHLRYFFSIVSWLRIGYYYARLVSRGRIGA